VKKVLHYIENGSRFNLVSFSHRVQVYRPEGLTVMSDAARRAASAWVDALEPSGQTDIWQALQKALEFCVEPGSEGVPRKDGADTIYLMTDGAPEPLGLVMGTNAICDRMRDWNRLRKFLFNTVYVSASTDRDFDNGTAFMRRLALESGGACKVPKLVPSGAGR
jgi:Mg-chelatase subunit ChlD